MKYATVDQLKNHLQVTDSTRDDYFDELLDRISQAVDIYTGRTFGTPSVTVTDETHSHIDNIPFTIWLKHVGITAITAISGRDKHSESWMPLAVDDYDWTDIGRLDIGRRYRYIKVSYTYDGGTTPPADVVQATLELATAEIASGVDDVTKTRIGDLEMTYKADSGSTTGAYALLDRYRVRSI